MIKNNLELMLISKKSSPKNVDRKTVFRKKLQTPKIFLNALSLRKIYIFEISKNVQIFTPILTHLMTSFFFWATKTLFGIGRHEIMKNTFSALIVEFD
jgi:hypothetical protein